MIHLEASRYEAIAKFPNTTEIVQVELHGGKDRTQLGTAEERALKFPLPGKKVYSIEFELEKLGGYTVVFTDKASCQIISRPILI